MPEYSIKNLKTFRGREGEGFNATLYRDGIKVALVMDSANGGEYRYEWANHASREEELLLLEHCAKQPQYTIPGFDRLFSVSPDVLLDGMVERFQQTKALKSLLTRHTLAVRPDGTIAKYLVKYTPAVGASIVQQQPAYRIMNSMPAGDAFAIYLATGEKK